ncbi:ABC transporter permease [Massilia sp. GCM10020059]|uniref:ABC transporter permease n=1 Tax=Massilia agrisoli TaxID=2892444 RepID=A0ABS8IS81_9BURK|nr:ABC transporter permease [Massilia agrisoli]MCC6070573.1 ABC transporter permease [Massilia agrisoli]
MTAFIALVRKDILLYLHDRRALVINLLLPILLAAFFGYLFGGSGKKEAGRLNVALVMQDTSATSLKIAGALKADVTLRLTEMPLAEAERLVRKGAQKVAIVIPAGFGDAAGAALFSAGTKPTIALLYDPSQQMGIAMVKGILTQHVMQAVSASMLGGADGDKFIEKSIREIDAKGTSKDEPLRGFLGSLQRYQAQQKASPATAGQGGGTLSVPFSTTERAMTSEKAVAGYNGYAHSFAGMAVQFILFMGIDMGVSVLLARRMGIWNRLLAAPISQTTVILARATSCTFIAMALMCIIFAVAVLVFGVKVSNIPGFLGVALCFAVMTASFGLLIAAFGSTPDAARGIAMFATLILVMLGGAWVPSFLFPEWVQTVTMFMPTRWAVDGFDAVTWRGLGMDVAGMSMAVQLGFAALFGTLALWQFKRVMR